MNTKDNQAATRATHVDLPDEETLRDAWRASAPQPTTQAIDNIHDTVKLQAKRHAAHKQRAIMFQRPLMLAAASIMIALGAFSLWRHQGANDTVWNELAMMEAQIQSEFNELDVQIWDALAELESESSSNDVLLDALAMQMMMWEEN